MVGTIAPDEIDVASVQERLDALIDQFVEDEGLLPDGALALLPMSIHRVFEKYGKKMSAERLFTCTLSLHILAKLPVKEAERRLREKEY